MIQHHHDDDNFTAGMSSCQKPTLSMGVVAAAAGSQPRFENISSSVVLRADAPGLGKDSVIASYRIVQQIGAGGMATVYEAEHLLLPRRAAIKVMHLHLCGESGVDARMIQEASILAELHHPGVVRVFDCDVLPDGRPWIAMELVAGESLGAKLARDKKVSTTEACNLISAVADVLATVHPRGIVHRDLKPDNILFAEADSGFPLRVIDWGVAHHELATRLTLDGGTCGTPVYMSPEQAAGHHIAPACDIYSLGVIAYEALAGVAPHEARTLADVVKLHRLDMVPLAEHSPTAPLKLCELIHRMLHKTATMRPSAAEVREGMQQIGLAIVDDGVEFASYEVTPAPAADVVANPKVRWTPKMSMARGSAYLLVRPQGGWQLASGHFKDEH
jgi:serine/threonine protein kinase